MISFLVFSLIRFECVSICVCVCVYTYTYNTMSDLHIFNSLYINTISLIAHYLSKKLVKQPNFLHCTYTSKFLPSENYRLDKCKYTGK